MLSEGEGRSNNPILKTPDLEDKIHVEEAEEDAAMRTFAAGLKAMKRKKSKPKTRGFTSGAQTNVWIKGHSKGN